MRALCRIDETRRLPRKGNQGLLDLHCHILPGVDDGAECMEESCEMAQLAGESGVRGLEATARCNIPGGYRNYWSDDMRTMLPEVEYQLQQKNIPLKLYMGMEVFATNDVPELLAAGKILTINNSRYLLIEFDFEESYVRAQRILQNTCAAGAIPIIAHPERYAFVQSDLAYVRELKDMGCILQINKGSLYGAFGRRSKDAAHLLMENRLADIVSSDAHGPYRRTPYMRDAHEVVCRDYSPDYAQLLFRDNPYRVLTNQRTLNPAIEIDAAAFHQRTHTHLEESWE